MPEENWSLLSSEGTVLVYIAMNSGVSTKQIACAIGITERQAWSVVARLRQAGTLRTHRDGHRMFYSADLDGPFLHPTIEGYTLRTFFEQFVNAKTTPRLRSHT